MFQEHVMKTVLIGLMFMNTQASQTPYDEAYFCAEGEWAEDCIPTDAELFEDAVLESEVIEPSATHAIEPQSTDPAIPSGTLPETPPEVVEEQPITPVHPIVNRPEYVTQREPLIESVEDTSNTESVLLEMPVVEVQEIPPQEHKTCTPATYHNDSRQVYLPYVDMPLYTDIDGKPLMLIGTYSATLAIVDGFSDFAVQALSFQATRAQANRCHAQFEPEQGILEIPQVHVPTLAMLSPGSWAQGPTITCQARLQQSVIRIEVFSLITLNCQ